MSGMFDGLASTLSWYTGYDFTGSATPAQSTLFPPAPSHRPPSGLPSSSSSSSPAARGTPDFSSLSGTPSSSLELEEEENLTSLYSTQPGVGDDEFFNLGGSSFPLLPHAPYMVDPFEEAEEDEEEREAKRTIAAATRHSHHFSSVLNNPLSSFSDFEEEDMLPFQPNTIPALAETSIDVAMVRAYVRKGGDVATYSDNHPGALTLPITELITPPSGSLRGSSSSSSTATPSLLSPFSSAIGSFTFTRRRPTSSSSSFSSSLPPTSARHRRGGSHPTAEQLQLKAKADEEAAAARDLSECLSTVPAPFFSPDFDLLQQPFFVDHLHSISFPASSSSSMRRHSSESLQLQSSLSSHLDQVELNLFRQINARSHLFFSQMARVEAMNADIGFSLSTISSLREAVAYVDESLTSSGLRVVELHIHRRNTVALMQRLEAMQMCQKTQHTVQLLLSTGDYTSSLMLIQQTRAVLAGELHGVVAMRNVERKLQEQVRLIEKLMEVDFVDLATQREEEQEEDGDERHGQQGREEEKRGVRSGEAERRRAGGAVQVIRRELSEEERERLVPILENLVKLHALPAVLSTYKRELVERIKQRLTDLVYFHIDTLVNEDLEEDAHAATAATNNTAAASSPTPSLPSDAHASAPPSAASSSPSSSTPPSMPSSLAASSASPSVVAPPSASTAAAPSSSPGASAITARRSPSPLPELPPHPSAATSSPPQPDTAPDVSTSVSSATAVHPSPAAPSPSPQPTLPSAPSPQPSSSTAVATPSSSSPPTPSAPSTITTRLQSLSHRQFIDFLSPLFSALMDPIYRAASIRSLLSFTLDSIERELDVTAGLTSSSSSSSSSPSDSRLLATLAAKKGEYQSNLVAFNELLSSASEYLHLRMAKLLHTRASLHSLLSLSDFRELLDVVLSFLTQSEGMCGRQFYGLRGALLGQAKGFVSNFHSKCIKEMADGLEKEKWSRVDVDVDYQELLDNGFVGKKDKAAPAAAAADARNGRRKEKEADDDGARADVNGKRGGEEEKNEERSANGVATSSPAKPTAARERKVLFVPIPRTSVSVSSPSPMASTSGAFTFPLSSASSPSSSSNFLKFPVVRSVLLLLVLVSHYVELSSQLPALTLDTLHRLLELLTQFNSRTCRLVLGAGAMHLAGLRSITATHLALSSQAISLLSTQIPRLRALFEQRLAVKHRLFLQGFDRVRQDCDEHVQQIREKLTNIMRDLIDASLKKMSSTITQQLKAGAGAAGGGGGGGQTGGGGVAEDGDEDEDDVVSPATRTLMKQTCSLHRALTDLLSVRERTLIFQAIGQALVGGFLLAARRVETEVSNGALVAGGPAAAASSSTKAGERLRLLLQANGLHILMRARTLTGVDEDVILQLKEFIETLKATH